MRRHEVLRTRFEEKEEGVVQVIGEGEDVEVGMVDLEEMGKEEREEEVKRIGREENGMGFDLRRGPLVRVKVLRGGKPGACGDVDDASHRERQVVQEE